MNRYYVKMDGEEMPKSYTYQELKDLGIFDFDDIQIRKSLDDTWYLAKYYSFPESSSSNVSGFHVDEFGQIHQDDNYQSGYTVDEFGQIVSTSVGTNNLSTDTSSRSSTNTYSSSSTGNDTDFWNGLLTFIKVIITIAIIGFLIFAFANDVKIGSGVLVASCFILKKMWDDD